MRKHRKAHRRSRLAAGITALAVAVPLITPAYAICHAPISGITPDNNVLKVSAHQDAMVAAEILGADLVATTNLGGEEDYDSSSANFTMGLFGSDINDNPDPYLYNFFMTMRTMDMSMSPCGTEAATARQFGPLRRIPSPTICCMTQGLRRPMALIRK